MPLPLDGSYRIAVEATDNQATGAFSVGLTELSDAVPITLNTVTPGAISQAAGAQLYSLNRTNGDVVSVAFTTPLVNTRPDLPVRLDLIRPDGSTAATTASCSTTASLSSVAVNQTGLWTIRVRAYEAWSNCGFGADTTLHTGTFTVRICPGSCP